MGEVLVGAVFFARLVAGVHFEPADLALAGVGGGDGGVEDGLGCRPDIDAGAVAANEGDDGVVRDDGFAVFKGDAFAGGWGRDFFVHTAVLLVPRLRLPDFLAAGGRVNLF